MTLDSILIAKKFITDSEGCKLTAYQDGGGVWTIGYGHTGPEVHAGLAWVQKQAEDALKDDLYNSYLAVRKYTSGTITDNQAASLISFTFNLGSHALATSTLLTKVKTNDLTGAAKEFIKWDHDNGKEVKGLLNRRLREALLYLQD